MDPTDVLTRPAEPPDAVLRYADHPDGVVDVFLPASLGKPDRPAELVVLVHGGFWRQSWDRMHVRPLAQALTQRGYVVAVPEYRRVGGTGGWPETGADVEAVLARLPGLLAQVAPGHAEPDAPYALMGHSAGGHLALWAGLRAGPERVRSVVGLAPVADIRYAAAQGMGARAVQDLLGGEESDVPDQYANADVLGLLRETTIPVTLIQGDADPHVDVAMNRRLAGQPELGHVRYLELAGVEHFALIDPLTATFEDWVLPALRDDGQRG